MKENTIEEKIEENKENTGIIKGRNIEKLITSNLNEEYIKGKAFKFIVFNKNEIRKAFDLNKCEIIKSDELYELKNHIKNFDTLREETKLSYYLLYYILKMNNIEFTDVFYNKNGKPYFKNDIKKTIKFNYSHTKNYIAIVISEFEVGIDIEQKDRVISKKLRDKYLNGEENMEALKLWVKKEAYSKMIGKGFQIGFDDLFIPDTYYFKEEDEYFLSIFVKV